MTDQKEKKVNTYKLTTLGELRERLNRANMNDNHSYAKVSQDGRCRGKNEIISRLEDGACKELF